MIAAEQISDHYFALNLDGHPERRFSTLAAAMTAALEVSGVDGSVSYHRDMTTAGQLAMLIRADGTWEPVVTPGISAGTDESGV